MVFMRENPCCRAKGAPYIVADKTQGRIQQNRGANDFILRLIISLEKLV